jgi:hypothetical protein
MSFAFVETECPVCFEDLFDENGVCQEAEGVAATVCHHVVHVRCLTSQCCTSSRDEQEEDSNNDASPQENSGSSSFYLFGQARDLYCPVCSRSVLIYSSSSEAAYFPGFWIPLIQSCIKQIAPSWEAVSPSSTFSSDEGLIEATLSFSSGGSDSSTAHVDDSRNIRIPAALIRQELRKDCSLTDSQKKFIDAPSNAGLQQALVWAGKVHRTIRTLHHHASGGLSSSSTLSSLASTLPTSSGVTLPGLSTRGLWQYDAQNDEICLW